MVAIVWPQTFDEGLLFHGVHLFGDGPKPIFRFEVGVICDIYGVGIAMCAVGAFAAFPLCFIFFVVQIFNADFASPPRWQFTPRSFLVGYFSSREARVGAVELSFGVLVVAEGAH